MLRSPAAAAATVLVALLLWTAAAVCANVVWQRLRERRSPAGTPGRPDRSATRELAALASSPDARVSGRALRAIAEHPALHREATGDVAEILRAGPSGSRAAAAATLEALASASPAYVPHLIADGSPLVRAVALRGLSRSQVAEPGGPAWMKLLVMALADSDEEVRLEACRSLATLEASGVARALARAQDDPSPRVRRAALSAAARSADAGALDAFVRALGDDARADHAEIAEALERRAGAPLASWLAKAASGALPSRVAYLRAIGTRPDLSAVGKLLPLLQDPEKVVRREAARAIAGIQRAAGYGAAAAVEHLVRRFDAETSRSSREALCEALACTGSRAALHAVRARLALPDPVIQERLRDAEAILEITTGAGRGG